MDKKRSCIGLRIREDNELKKKKLRGESEGNEIRMRG